MSRWIWTLTLLLVCISCGDEEEPRQPCAGDGIIAPGAGVGVGGHVICVGEGADALGTRLGTASRVMDLGDLGRRVAYDKLKLALLYTGAAGAQTLEAVYLGPDSTLKTSGGVGPGSSEAAVKAALGEPVKDPFIGAWSYPALGLTLQFEGGKVVAVQVAAPSAGK